MNMWLQHIDTNSFISWLYLTPKELIDNPEPTAFKSWDIVEILEGSSKWKLWTVIVPRNGNYKDYEPYMNKESVWILVVVTDSPKDQLTKELMKALWWNKEIRTEVQRGPTTAYKFVLNMDDAVLNENSANLN